MIGAASGKVASASTVVAVKIHLPLMFYFSFFVTDNRKV
jgi:hypothetical protein